MAAYPIIAGRVEQINEHSGDWLIVDIGISPTTRSCGVWYGPGTLDAINFGKLVALAIEKVEDRGRPPLNLLIEAPLSVALRPDNGAALRLCDTWKGKKRFWHFNAGATTLLAAQMFLRALYECQTRQRTVRLFEGHLSFKSGGNKGTQEHKDDAWALKEAVWNEKKCQRFGPRKLIKEGSNLRVESPFPFFGKCLIPPVIRIVPGVNPDEQRRDS